MTVPAVRTSRNRTERVTRFQVMGARCSGTNFLAHLVARTFPGLSRAEELGWKHGFFDRRLSAMPGLLTLIVYRHPVRWLQSVHRTP